jgi:hypothetical protein
MTSGIMDDEKKYGAKAPQTGQIKRRNTAINRTK